MREITPTAFSEAIASGETTVLFWYTPLCGTCKVAARMLEVVEAAMPALRLASLNVNAAAQQAQQWRIESVPCITIVKNGALVDKTYKMESVQTLFALFRTHLDESTQP